MATKTAISPLLLSGNVESLVAQMTVEEKCAFLSGRTWWESVPIPRLGIPSLFMTDGPHGVRKGIKTGTVPATCFPTACALASTWDVALMEQLGLALATEARSQEVAILLGPGINIKRSPLCGRNFEYFSADPKLSGSLAAAYVRGLQCRGVGASVKHFAANNQESCRMGVSAEVDQRTLREIYLAAFEEVVKEAKPWTLMCSYNKINGVYAAEDPWLLTEVLRKQWGFDGFVVSDWGAVNNRAASVAAGLDLEMPSTGPHSPKVLADALKSGQITEAQINEACANILKVFHKHLSHPFTQGPPSPMPVEEHHALARQFAADSIVLLKNTGNILPLDPQKSQKLAIIGYFAAEPRYQGSGSSRVNPTKMDSALTEIKALARQTCEITYAAGFTADGSNAASLHSEALRAVSGSDTALLFLGLPEILESEGFDRHHIHLPTEQLELLAAVCKAQPRTIVILSNGSIVSLSSWVSQPSAILEAWLGGQGMGGAIADILFGVRSPSGRLPETVPMRLEDTPSFLWFPGTDERVDYREGVMVDYRYYETVGMPVLFEFGFGLGYTTFEFGGMEVGRTEMTDKETVKVSVEVRNTGKRPGREVVQLYVGDDYSQHIRGLLDSPMDRRNPAKELRAFAKTPELKPGESTRVSFELGKRAFAHFDDSSPDKWTVGAPNKFKIMVGASVRDIRLQASIVVKSSTSRVGFSRDTPIRKFIELQDSEINALLQPAMPFNIQIATDALTGKKVSTSAEYDESLMLVASFSSMPLHKTIGWSRGKINEDMIGKVVRMAAKKVAAKL